MKTIREYFGPSCASFEWLKLKLLCILERLGWDLGKIKNVWYI